MATEFVAEPANNCGATLSGAGAGAGATAFLPAPYFGGRLITLGTGTLPRLAVPVVPLDVVVVVVIVVIFLLVVLLYILADATAAAAATCAFIAFCFAFAACFSPRATVAFTRLSNT